MFKENIKLAFSSLRINKSRTFLTMLGIIIGIASIIAITTIGNSLTASMEAQFADMGVNQITVSLRERGAVGDEWGNIFTNLTPTSGDLVTLETIDDLRHYLGSDIEGIQLMHHLGTAQARDGAREANINVIGANTDYFATATQSELVSGRFPSQMDQDQQNMVTTVSEALVSLVFGDGVDPIGQQVFVYREQQIEVFTVVGVFRPREVGIGLGASTGTGAVSTLPTNFYIPFTVAGQQVFENNMSQFTVVAVESDHVETLTERIQVYLDTLYQHNATWHMHVSNMVSMLASFSQMNDQLVIAIAGIAGVSLLVGGIGVMNIMLVSVTERTREIGTRKALGAKRFHIQLQFVMEALIVSLLGGIIGLGLGGGIGVVGANMLNAPLDFDLWIALGSALFSMALGVFFGIYPANKAAKMDPIDALRYE